MSLAAVVLFLGSQGYANTVCEATTSKGNEFRFSVYPDGAAIVISGVGTENMFADLVSASEDASIYANRRFSKIVISKKLKTVEVTSEFDKTTYKKLKCGSYGE